jgi:transcriptional regulator with GAF, ATPase, and Fis domain
MEEMITMSSKECKRAEVMAMIHSGSMRQAAAAELLELSIRQVKRLYQKYKEHGIKV